ncbi:hypothetical protein ACPD08_001516 [Escherichia coli]
MKNNSALFVGSFFESDQSSKVNLALSYDGERFEKIKAQFLWAIGGTGEVLGRDPSIIYHNGWWLIAVSGYTENVYDVDCWRSRDLTVWELVRIKLGDTPVCGKRLPGSDLVTTDVWAPEWFVDDENLFLIVSLRYYNDQTDSKGVNVKSFKTFYSVCSDVERLEFYDPVAVNIEPKNIIDSVFSRIFQTYYLTIKDEITKKIEVYCSNCFSGQFTKLSVIPFTQAAEGPALVYLPDGTIRIYADFFDTKKWTYFVDTKDFVTFTPERPVLFDGRIKRGTITNVLNWRDSETALQQLSALFCANSGDLQPGKIHKLIDVAGTSNINATDLIWWPETGHCYFTEGLSGNVTINALPTVYPDGSSFYLMVRSATPGAGDLTLKQAVGDLYHPANGMAIFDADLVVAAGGNAASRLFRMVCFDGQLWVEGVF